MTSTLDEYEFKEYKLATIRNLIIEVEHTGKRIPVEEIDSTVAALELLNALAPKINIPIGTNGVLIRKVTRKMLLPNQSLGLAGIEDGETLIADFERTAGGGIAINSYRDIQIINAVLRHDLVASYHPYALYAIILYTAADKNLADFVRNNFHELHSLAGYRCVFYIIEKPDPKWLPIMREELTAKLGPHIERVWRILEKDQFLPVDSSSVYEIASRIGIKRAQIPCITFFSNLNSKELLVVPFDSLIDKNLAEANEQDFLQLFRDMFDRMDLVASKREDERVKEIKREIARMRTDRAISKIETIALPEAVKGLIGVIIKILIA